MESSTADDCQAKTAATSGAATFLNGKHDLACRKIHVCCMSLMEIDKVKKQRTFHSKTERNNPNKVLAR